jgi:hypothetical protein
LGREDGIDGKEKKSKKRSDKIKSASMGKYKADEDVENCLSLINIGGEAKKRV